MRPAWLACALLISASIGCVRVADPCPPGQSLRRDHCVPENADAETSESGALAIDAATEDAGPDPLEEDAADSAELDAEPEAGELDAEPEAGDADAGLEPLVDAEQLDATPDSGPDSGADADSGPDAEAGADADSGELPDAGDGGAPFCTAADLDEWQDFHLSTQLTFDVGACSASHPSCSGSSCALADCLRERLRMTTCEECVAQEVACVAASCAQPCAASQDDQACRACACKSRCIVAFDACSGAARDLCADCDGTTCTNRSLPPPELIMVIVRQAMLQ